MANSSVPFSGVVYSSPTGDLQQLPLDKVVVDAIVVDRGCRPLHPTSHHHTHEDVLTAQSRLVWISFSGSTIHLLTRRLVPSTSFPSLHEQLSAALKCTQPMIDYSLVR